MDAAFSPKVTGIAEASIRKAAQWWGPPKAAFSCTRHRASHPAWGTSAINIVWLPGASAARVRLPATITGQGNGQGGREHGQKCDQLPGGRDIENTEHRAHVAKVWGITPEELPRGGVDAYEVFRRVDRGEVRGLLSICFNPLVSLPDSNFIKRILEQLEFFVTIDFFMSETGRYADIILPVRCGERRNSPVRTCHQDQSGGRLSRRRPAGLAHHSGHRPRPRARKRLHLRQPA